MKRTAFDELLVAIASGNPVELRDIMALAKDINAFGDTVPRTVLMAATYAGRDDLLRDLVSNGATIDLVNEYGMAAIHEAALLGHATTIKTLHGLGADIEAKSRNGWTPLMFASSTGESAAVRLLLSLGANMHCRNQDGMTALDIADQKDREVVVAILTEAIKS